MRKQRKRNIAPILAPLCAAVFLAMVLPLNGCSSESTAATSPAAARANAEDKAAQLAAQVQLRNAQTAQESYFSQHQMYASTSDDLATANPALNLKVEVTKGDRTSFEMKVTAGDSGHTVYIIRKNGSEIERVDGNDNPW